MPMHSFIAADVEPRNAEWFIPDHIALSDVTLVAAPKGVGKSQFAAHLASVATTSKPFSKDGATRTGKPRNVLLFSGERGLATTVRPRLEAAGADLARVRICGNSVIADIPQIIQEIRRAAEQHQEDMGLIIIDPIDSYGMPNTSRKARTLLQALYNEAQDCRATIVCIQNTLMKMKPRTDMPASAAIRGTSTTVDFCVSTWMIEPVPTGGAIIECVESNYCNKGKRYTFTIEGAKVADVDTSRLVMGGPSEMTIQEARLHPNRSNTQGRNGISFLLSRLARGVYMRAAPLLADAQTVGITPRDLQGARERLGVTSRKARGAGPDSGWEWCLGQETEAPQAVPCETSINPNETGDSETQETKKPRHRMIRHTRKHARGAVTDRLPTEAEGLAIDTDL